MTASKPFRASGGDRATAPGCLAVGLEAIAAAAEAGLEYVLTRPVVSAGMIAVGLVITSRVAQDLVGELGLREATGRGRYRAWGILLNGCADSGRDGG